MKPAPFDYVAPRTVADAIGSLAELGDEAKVLAGGQSLVPVLAMRLARPERLVDVTRVAELREVRRDGDVLVVGATTRHVTLERDPVIGAAVPLLQLAAPFIGHFQIRNRGTLGGSLAHADPAAELPVVARVLDAEIVVRGPASSRTIPAEEFFESVFTTALEPDELLTAVRFPVWGPGSGFAVDEVTRRHRDFPLAAAMAAVQVTDGRITRVGIGMGGMGSTPLRAPAAERALLGSPVSDLDPDAVGAAAVADVDPPTDLHAGADYRRKVGAMLVARVVEKAVQEALDA